MHHVQEDDHRVAVLGLLTADSTWLPNRSSAPAPRGCPTSTRARARCSPTATRTRPTWATCRAPGKTVAIRLRDTAGDARRVQGVLVGADDATATVRLDAPGPDGVTERVVRLDQIDRARTVFAWGPTPKPGGPKKGAAKAVKGATGAAATPTTGAPTEDAQDLDAQDLDALDLDDLDLDDLDLDDFDDSDDLDDDTSSTSHPRKDT